MNKPGLSDYERGQLREFVRLERAYSAAHKAYAQKYAQIDSIVRGAPIAVESEGRTYVVRREDDSSKIVVEETLS